MDDIETRGRKRGAARFGVEECDIRLDSDVRNDFGAEWLEGVELGMATETGGG
ncbi:acyl carrier protein, partial [Pseudomonas aeruginosa]|uniref:acyl carrier protein n=1 Tax=Pseudomonas aeruginosa TaxID=287 RepID=UPI001D0A2636